MAGIIIVVLLLIFLFNSKPLPKVGTWLGNKSRKPYRQAKWVWSSFAGTEEESISAEQDYGEECARAFASQFAGESSARDQELVSGIGAKLADAVNDPRRRFRFSAVSSGIANAFALPGGFVFITGALLDLCDRDRNEIAFFLGHEVGHVIRGHARDRLAVDSILNAVSSRLPAAGRMVNQVVSKGYSRVQELEADREAVRLAAAAGFDADASVTALRRLMQVSPDPSKLGEYLSSHPPMSERVQKLQKERPEQKSRTSQ